MKKKIIILINFSIFILIFLQSCKNSSSDNNSSHNSKVPVVTSKSENIMYSWLDDSGEIKLSQKMNDIPEHKRKIVIVKDLNQPPPEADKLWVADLTKSDKKGIFLVKQINRDDFVKLSKLNEGPIDTSSTIVMYMSPTCPVCRQAEQWLKEKQIPYVLKNIESDTEARQELQLKASKQGIPIQGVPVFEVKGKIVPGFDPEILSKILYKNTI